MHTNCAINFESLLLYLQQVKQIYVWLLYYVLHAQIMPLSHTYVLKIFEGMSRRLANWIGGRG